MTLMLLLSGLGMFMLNTSLSIEGTSAYYAPKSFYGLLETVSPHLFGMGLTGMFAMGVTLILKSLGRLAY